MASAVIGALRVVLGLDSAQFSAGLNTSGNRLAAFASRATSIAGTLTKLGGAAVAATAAAATALTVTSMNAIDAQSKLARQLGGTVVGIQSLERAGDLAGVSQETLTAAMTRLNAVLGATARTGAGPAFDALRNLGLSAQELSDMDAPERLAMLADRMKEGGYSAQQMADTLRQLGIRQAEVISLVEDGGDAIRNARGEVERYGVAVSDIQARQIEQANDAWSNIGFTLKGVGNQIAVRVAPIIEGLAKAFGDGAQAAGGFGDIIQSVMDRIFNVVGWIADRVYQIGFAFKTLELGINILLLGLAKVGDWFGDNSEGVDYYRGRITELTNELNNLHDNGLPSERLDQWVASVRAASEETARAAQLTGRFAAMFGGPAPVAGLEEFRDDLRTREELARDAYEERLAQLDAFVAAEQLTEEEAAAAKLRIEQQYRDALSDMHQTSNAENQRLLDQRVENEKIAAMKITDAIAKAEQDRIALRQAAIGAVGEIMGSISAIIGDGSKRAFEISKKFAIAEALINVAQGVTKALAGPFPLINAAKIAAAGAAQIVAIRRQQPGGGSVTPVASGGGGATGSDGGGSGASAPPPQTIHISGLEADQRYSGRQITELLTGAFKDGYRIVLSDGKRIG